MSDKGTPAISIQGARKVYQSFPGKSRIAVQDVSIEVPQGAIHGLLGPNGAGKTTTIKMFMGLVRPTAGTFEILGAPSSRPANRSPLGFLAEQPYFPSQLTAMQAMKLYAKLAGVPASERAGSIEEMLEKVGLGRHGHARISEYSRGMLQRLGIAQALVSRPSVVILDEPASGLDPVGQRDVRNIMLALKAEGVTVLLSSHQLSEVEAICDRVSILDRGRLAAEGPLADLLDVAGVASVSAASLPDPLPEALRRLVSDAAQVADSWTFSVADADVRAVVDAIDDAGGRLVSVARKRESLEDYFSRLLERPEPGRDAA